MKTLTLILVVAVTGLAVASVQFAQRAATQKARADAEVALRQKQDLRLRELERAQASLEQQLMEAQRPRMAGLGEPPEMRRAAPPAFGSSAAHPEARPESARGDFVWNTRPGFLGPMQSAAGQKFARTQMRDYNKRLYADVGRELNLSADQADRLIELMANPQGRFGGEGRPMPMDRASAQQALKEIVEQNRKEVAAIIGDGKMAQWADYQKSLPQRAQVDQIRQQLDSAGLPLSADQRTELVTAMVEESKSNPRPPLASGMALEDLQKQQSDWQEAYDKSVAERAKQVLSSEQYDRYHQYQEWMADMRRSLPRPMDGKVARFSAASGAVAVAAPTVVFQAADGAPPPPPP